MQAGPTLELADPPHAAYVDAIEVGRRVAGHVRIAFEVGDTAATAAKLAAAGATIIAEPSATPWRSLELTAASPGWAAASPCSPPSTHYHGPAVDANGRPPA